MLRGAGCGMRVELACVEEAGVANVACTVYLRLKALYTRMMRPRRQTDQMRRWLALGTALAALSPAFAQPPEDANARRDALEWAVALRGRIRTMSNPVVAAFGLTRLGGV